MAGLARVRIVGRPLRLLGSAGRFPVVGRAVRRGGLALFDLDALERASFAGVRPDLAPPGLRPAATATAAGTPSAEPRS